MRDVMFLESSVGSALYVDGRLYRSGYGAIEPAQLVAILAQISVEGPCRISSPWYASVELEQSIMNSGFPEDFSTVLEFLTARRV